MTITELLRLLQNIIRIGTITDVDHDKELCRVATGELETNWIRWLALAAGTTRDWNPPTVGEQVLLLSPGGDPANAVALCGIYSDAAPAPSHDKNTRTTQYPDSAVIEYNHAAHSFTATLPAGATINIVAPKSVTITTQLATVVADAVMLDAKQTTCNGHLTVNGNIAATGDVTAGNISLKNHVHMPQAAGKPTTKPL